MSSVIVRILCLTLLTLKAHCNSFGVTSIGNTLSVGDSLKQGELLLSSNGEYVLVLQGDGNLVVYSTMNGQALWGSHTNDGKILYYQGDGNLVLYNSQTNIWSSKTDGTHQPGRVEMRNDGYFVILDDMFNEVWNCREWEEYSSVQTVPYPFPPPEPCDIGDTYDRSLKLVTCPDDKVTMAELCYYPCDSGYSSTTGFDCIEDCPSGYTDMGLVCTNWDKMCEDCQQICVPLVGCNKICSGSVPCPDTKERHIYNRSPSYPDSCPPGYKDPTILSGGTFCYESCEPGFLDLGVVCTCEIFTYHSLVVIYAEKFRNFYNIYITQLLDELNLLNCLTGSSLGIDIMKEFIPAIKVFIANVDGIVNDIVAGNDKLIIVLEIGCSAASAISIGIGAFGYVFDPNTNKYYYYEGAHCYGLATDVSASVDVSLFLFHSIDDVPGISQLLGVGLDDWVGDAMVITSETYLDILAPGFSFSYGTPGAWPVASWHMCETPELKEI